MYFFFLLTNSKLQHGFADALRNYFKPPNCPKDFLKCVNLLKVTSKSHEFQNRVSGNLIGKTNKIGFKKKDKRVESSRPLSSTLIQHEIYLELNLDFRRQRFL